MLVFIRHFHVVTLFEILVVNIRDKWKLKFGNKKLEILLKSKKSNSKKRGKMWLKIYFNSKVVNETVVSVTILISRQLEILSSNNWQISCFLIYNYVPVVISQFELKYKSKYIYTSFVTSLGSTSLCVKCSGIKWFFRK